MNKKEIYERIVQLTAELAKTGVAKEIFSSADAGDAVQTQKIIDDFPKEYPELNDKIVSFGDELNKFIEDGKTGWEASVLGEKADEEHDIFMFDTNIIDPLSLYTLSIFGEFDNDYIFQDSCLYTFVETLEEAGYEDLAEFAMCYVWTDWVGEDEDEYATIGELLVAVFAGTFEDSDY